MCVCVCVYVVAVKLWSRKPEQPLGSRSMSECARETEMEEEKESKRETVCEGGREREMKEREEILRM